MRNLLKILLEEKMRKEGLSEREVARQVGFSNSTIARIMHDKPVDLPTVIEICKWMNVTPSSVLDSEVADAAGLAAKVTAFLEANPKLAESLKEVMDQLDRERLDPSIMQEIVSFIHYKLSMLNK